MGPASDLPVLVAEGDAYFGQPNGQHRGQRDGAAVNRFFRDAFLKRAVTIAAPEPWTSQKCPDCWSLVRHPTHSRARCTLCLLDALRDVTAGETAPRAGGTPRVSHTARRPPPTPPPQPGTWSSP